jgi:uncharacterized protein (UPF0297 family)
MKNQYTEIFQSEKFDNIFTDQLHSVCCSIASTGLDPYSQLMGYLLTGEDCYITRTGNARAIINDLDKDLILAYVKQNLEKT